MGQFAGEQPGDEVKVGLAAGHSRSECGRDDGIVAVGDSPRSGAVVEESGRLIAQGLRDRDAVSRSHVRERVARVDALLSGGGVDGYPRHAVDTPVWLPAMALHATSIAGGNSQKEETHRDHVVLANLHYEKAEVKAAVNKKKANLRAKHRAATKLGAET